MKSTSLLATGGMLTALLMCVSLSGCVVTQDGVTYDVNTDTTFDASFDTGVDYIEPAGAFVGGWVSTYNIAPSHPVYGGGPRPAPGVIVPPHPIQGAIHPTLQGGRTHVYNPPPASHSAPSIPTAHRK